MPSADEDVEQLELSCITGGNEDGKNHSGKWSGNFL